MPTHLIDELRQASTRELAAAIDRGEAAVAYAHEPAKLRLSDLAAFCATIAAHRGGLALVLGEAATRLDTVLGLASTFENEADELELNAHPPSDARAGGLRDAARRLREALGAEREGGKIG